MIPTLMLVIYACESKLYTYIQRGIIVYHRWVGSPEPQCSGKRWFPRFLFINADRRGQGRNRIITMKYYFLGILDQIKWYSQKLDAKAILYNKNWEIFNDDGTKEVFIFRPGNELFISVNGIVSKAKWEILSTGFILIDIQGKSYLFKASFVSPEFMTLNLDGNQNALLMMEENRKRELRIRTLSDINAYLKRYVLEKQGNYGMYPNEYVKSTKSNNRQFVYNEENTSLSTGERVYLCMLIIGVTISFLYVIYNICNN